MNHYNISLSQFYGKNRDYRLFILFWLAVYGLVIFQDYVYALLRDTGFYWSEVTTFNSYWLLFMPFIWFLLRITKKSDFLSKTALQKGIKSFVLATIFSVLHIFLFACIVTTVSNLLFSPPHPFWGTLFSSLSNDAYITLLVYFLVPYVYQLLRLRNRKDGLAQNIIVKQGNQQVSVSVVNIHSFASNKPYVEICTGENKYLQNSSLKNIERSLDSTQFLRVHRSVIINQSYITGLRSRKNGDYDVTLQGNKTFRMSRHYRKNWKHLISNSIWETNPST